MNILAFDTVSSSFSIAIKKDEDIIEYNKENVPNHNEEILPNLHNFLKENFLTLDEISYIALGIGPGSFTALRIAFSTIKAIAYSKKIPVIGISSLDSLYKNIEDYNGIKASMIDARKGSVYTSIYKDKECIKKDIDIKIEDFVNFILSITSDDKTITLCGDGYTKSKDLFEEFFKKNNISINILDASKNIIHASNTIKLSEEMAKRKQFDNIFTLLPLYVRKSEAEINKESNFIKK